MFETMFWIKLLYWWRKVVKWVARFTAFLEYYNLIYLHVFSYLYYTIKPYQGVGGLYVVDIADFDLTGEPSPTLLIEGNIKTFTIDHENLLLYYPNNSLNTVMAAYLDGTGPRDTRMGKVAVAHFYGLSSLVHYDRKYFWTNGSMVLGEEVDTNHRMYYHHTQAFLEKHFVGFNLYYPGSQPLPGKKTKSNQINHVLHSHHYQCMVKKFNSMQLTCQ